jgi:hypothetical protein
MSAEIIHLESMLPANPDVAPERQYDIKITIYPESTHFEVGEGGPASDQTLFLDLVECLAAIRLQGNLG